LVEDSFTASNITSQCWSSDDRQIVYETDDSQSADPDETAENIRVYDLGLHKSRWLAKGTSEVDSGLSFPSWKQDGEWIAFLRNGTYFAVHPSGERERVLFRKWIFPNPSGQSGVWWSPDRHLVAYVGACQPLEPPYLPMEIVTGLAGGCLQLRVRRLDNGSEIAVDYLRYPISFQWLTNVHF